MASISTCLFVRLSGHTLLACFSDVLRSVYGQEWYSGVKKICVKGVGQLSECAWAIRL